MADVYSITAKELAELGRENLPQELQSSKHFIYSSPATLAFNSPGAQGFGVKRAGLSIPGSVMLLVAPGCCGRNTAALNALGYRERFFYLLMDDTDIVTGRHLGKISKAVQEVVESLDYTPTVVMICITCVDALLGTDMDRVCRKASAKAGVPVLPCYMYALTREGRVPPMVSVRKTLYSLLEPRKKKANVVNLLGEFSPFADHCELYDLLHSIGIKKVQELSRCKTYEDYLCMAEANFNLILNPEARNAAADIQKNLGIPSLELTRVYQLDKIKKQYELLGTAIGVNFADEAYYEKAKEAVEHFKEQHAGTAVAIGEWMNGNPFELALALLRMGMRVPEIYGTVGPEQFVYIRKIAELSPETRIYSNLQPSMLNYDVSDCKADLTIGQDAGYYHTDAPNIPWNGEVKPFGYQGLVDLLAACEKALSPKEDA